MNRVGVEVGGTFTDLVAIKDNQIIVRKVPSTPDSPEQGAFNALNASRIPWHQIDDLIHGSTVATNAILERKGAKIALLLTKGTRDILLLQRHNRRDIYALDYSKPEPVVPRRDCYEIPERIDHAGNVIDAIDLNNTREIILSCLQSDYDAIAICLLNAYVNNENELRLLSLVRELNADIPVSCSSQVMPVFREYERCSTTALAAYVQPVIAQYLQQFERELMQKKFAGRFSIMQSNGGRLPAEAMAGNAITSLFSGPAAGVVGATKLALQAGFENVITLDMGGTSTDVCLVEEGTPQVVNATEVDGLPVHTPVIDIATVGAGGGSIIWVDDGGLLRVGPESAGASPGPASYGNGGKRPTITDAHLVRGTIRESIFDDSELDIDLQAAKHAFNDLSQTLNLTAEAMADAAVRVAESNIVRAIQRISTERGKDPRDYVLVAFGGAGPLQAARIAEELGIDHVLVPPHAGVLSALGLLTSDYIHYVSQTRQLRVVDDNMDEIRQLVKDLESTIDEKFTELDLLDTPTMHYTFEMRYVTQAFEIPVTLSREMIGSGSAQSIAECFHQQHHAVFEFDERGRQECEIISIRVGGSVTPPPLPESLFIQPSAEEPESVSIFEQGRKQQAQVRTRSLDLVHGPSVLEDGTSTIFLPEGWYAKADTQGNLMMTNGEQ